MKTRRELILLTVGDLVSRFVYYDRKEDEQLPVLAIEKAIAAAEISVEEIVSAFRDRLSSAIHARGDGGKP